MIVYSNSDSYGVLSTTNSRYSDFLSQELNAKVINSGKNGSCNQRIFRTSIRDLIKLRASEPEEEILALVCLGALHRTEWWNPDYRPRDNEIDGHFCSLQIHNLNKTHPTYAKEWFKVFDDEAEQTNLLMNLVLFTTWLKNNNIKYIIFAGNNVTYKKISYDNLFIKDFSDKIFNDPGILNINTVSFTKYCLDLGHVPFDYDLYQEHGHHGELAHKDFAKFLLQLYQQTKSTPRIS